MRSIISIFLILATQFVFADENLGHSKHGSAFDSGMRTRPWVMKGIGNAPFPITSKNPEVQKWFNQGNALLQSFWFEEAERSFRWCIKLDPDCAMAYWGLSLCGYNWFTMLGDSLGGSEADRAKIFLAEAVKRKFAVTERERLYIEAWENATANTSGGHMKILNKGLQNIVIKYPNDIEAKALLALFNINQGSEFANQLLIQQVLDKNPMHPGAHHASIHNWDGVSSAQAIRSCELYGKSAPSIGHARHMPGHIYSKIGMWHEAAIAMDSATRTELKYMNDRLALPFETWNFAHNRNYLCYIQEQLGMANTSIQGAKDLITAPRDPDINPGLIGALSGQGQEALIRATVKFERWDEILKPGQIEWVSYSLVGQFEQCYCECLALCGKGRFAEAKVKLENLKQIGLKLEGNPKSGEFPESSQQGFMVNVVEGIYLSETGDLTGGMVLLNKAASYEQGLRKRDLYGNDPGGQPWPVQRLIGDQFFKKQDYSRAISAYKIALENEPNDGFSLSGLARSYFATGDKVTAKHFAGRLMYVWSKADSGLPWLEEVKKLNLNPTPVAETIERERVYNPKDLDKIGPMNWQPFAAPALNVKDRNGKLVRLEDFRGKNVLLVFFLSDTCVHCVAQLKLISDKAAKFADQNTVLLGVCSSTPEVLKASTVLGEEKINFLSDTNHENARRFASYDDFEDMELHSTILIDTTGKVRWKRTGGDPFTNISFLLQETKRVNSTK